MRRRVIQTCLVQAEPAVLAMQFNHLSFLVQDIVVCKLLQQAAPGLWQVCQRITESLFCTQPCVLFQLGIPEQDTVVSIQRADPDRQALQGGAMVASELVQLGCKARQALVVGFKLLLQQVDLAGLETGAAISFQWLQQCCCLHRSQQGGKILFQLGPQAQAVQRSQLAWAQLQCEHGTLDFPLCRLFPQSGGQAGNKLRFTGGSQAQAQRTRHDVERTGFGGLSLALVAGKKQGAEYQQRRVKQYR